MTRLLVHTHLFIFGLLALAVPSSVQAQPASTTISPSPAQRPVENRPPAASSKSKTPATAESSGNSTAAAPATATVEIGEFQPVLHARAVKVNTCMDNLVGQSALAIDRPHKAISSWVTAAPNEHGFNSIVGMNYPNRIAPNGLAILLAIPKDQNACEGQSVQIYPTSQACTVVQAAMVKSGRTLDTIEKMPVVEGRDGTRNVLMPSAGGGCVVVSVKLH